MIKFYTVYKDIQLLNRNASIEFISNSVREQKNRDRILLLTMNDDNIPRFPMGYDTFDSVKHKLFNLSLGDRRLCMLFVYSDGGVLGISYGEERHFLSFDAAHRHYCATKHPMSKIAHVLVHVD